ncbi:MAG: hypothetical protein MUC48_20300 [Leptolyngbya sp. Prado105]|jgi:hypothetical protein|nr:hypothetical protein [Leptolyngbya sp. Prado105]
MFLTELSPLVQEFAQQPIAFMGGLFTGLLKLSLAEDPVRSWLDQQTGSTPYTTNGNGHNSSAPKSITID